MTKENGKPQIRFAKFKDTWEQRKVKDLCSISTGKSNTQDKDEDGEYPFFVRSPIIERSTKYLYDEEAVITVGDGVGTGKVFHYVNGKYDLHQRCYRMYDFTSELNAHYFYHVFSKLFHNRVMAMTAKTSVDSVRLEMIADMEIPLPNIDEQREIGAYLDNLDNLITLHQRKYDKLTKVKKSMLEKMFPKNGTNVPEIRFKGFTDAWEQRKLDDWGDFYYGRSCPKWSVTEDATIPCIRYGELYTKFGAKIDRVYSYTNMPPENLRFSKGTEVLIPRVGEDPMDYNHCTWLSMPDIAIGEMISVFNTDNNPLFTATMFNATLQNEFAMRVEGGSVTNLYFEKLKNIEVSFPSIPEQEKIAAYFADLDHLITLHQRKLEKLKILKKACLEKMFV